MCGVAGFLDTARARPRDELRAIAGEMAATLAHRGPDAAGVWTDARAGIALGHRRLAVIDLTPGGAQPMVSPNGRYVLSFNGEIYGHRALRAELPGPWRGTSDTEVVLRAIQTWGLDAALRRVNGMFGIALWDAVAQRLSLARDRFGEKPMYHGWCGTSFCFGSEPQALRAHPSFDASVSPDALALLLRLKYIPAPHTIWSGIAKLEPGTIASIDAEATSGTAPRVRRFAGLRETIEMARGARITDGTEAVDEAERVLGDAVALRMEADVPLGAFLSGGIDSTLVVALMTERTSAPVRTFTIGTSEPSFDESVQAAAVARALGTDHTEMIVTAEEARAVIPDLPAIYAEPFADSSQIPTTLVSRLARHHVTVALSGDGGDELFGGYNRYGRGIAAWRRMRRLPGGARRLAARALTAASPGTWDAAFARAGRALPRRWRERTPGDKVHKLAGAIAADGTGALYQRLVSHWVEPVVLGAGELPTAADDLDAWGADPVEAMMAADAAMYLPEDILAKVDRASMSVGLEARVPLLDPAVVSFAWRLPASMKARDGASKWILRQVLARRLPPELTERPKMGFGVPIAAWLRGPLRDWADDLLSEPRLRRDGLFDPAPIATAWREHRSGRRNRAYELWDVLMAQAWLDHHVPATREVRGALA